MEDVYIGERVPFLDEVQKITTKGKVKIPDRILKSLELGNSNHVKVTEENGKIILAKVTEYSTAVDDQVKPERRTKHPSMNNFKV